MEQDLIKNIDGQAPENQYIALFGAFDRDNFGDILFYIITKKLLALESTVALGITFANMKKEGLGWVFPLRSWLMEYRQHSPYAILCVGGETLSCKYDGALASCLKEDTAFSFLKMKKDKKRKIFNTICGLNDFPYLISEKEITFVKPQRPKIIYNSVGGITRDTEKKQLSRICKILSLADYISVRNEEAYEILNENGIKAFLNPDIVHALPLYFQKHTLHKKITHQQYILVQISSDFIRLNNMSLFTKKISSFLKKHNVAIVFQPAGIAALHDKFEDYSLLKKRLIRSGICADNIFIQRDRDALVQVSTIANASIVLSNSLHVRIVAMSYAIPRVSMQNNKVTSYLNTWEKTEQPYDVSVTSVLESLENALVTPKKELDQFAKDIALKAMHGFEELKTNVSIDKISDAPLAETELLHCKDQMLNSNTYALQQFNVQCYLHKSIFKKYTDLLRRNIKRYKIIKTYRFFRKIFK